MRRRKIAVLLASLLGLAAGGLVGAFAFLELSPRDYRLAWLLRRTKKIELCTARRRWRVGEIDRAEDVASIVCALTTELDRPPRSARPAWHDFKFQARLEFEGGGEVIARWRVEEDSYNFGNALIELPDGTIVERTTSEKALSNVLRERYWFGAAIRLGAIDAGGERLDVHLDEFEADGEHALFVTFRPAGFRGPDREHSDLAASLVWKDGRTEELVLKHGFLEAQPTKHLEDIERVDVSRGERRWSFPVPPIRYDKDAARLSKPR